MPSDLDIEQPALLLAYLRANGWMADRESAEFTVLGGGVSNRTVRVTFPGGRSWVIKQALPRLRVAEDWFSDPARVHREALGLLWFGKFAAARSVPAVLFEDPAHHLLAMEAVPEPHANWKQCLLRGEVEPGTSEQFGGWLGSVHRESRELRTTWMPLFEDRTFFKTLRLEPYYAVAASRNQSLAPRLEALMADTLAVQECLVHGDYSPKNILVREGRLVVLDFEVAHLGDPAFDVGFALTHLLSKAHHLPASRPRLVEAARAFCSAYAAAAGPILSPALEARAVRHTLGCLLARIDGRSPLEYLSPTERDRQRAAVRHLWLRGPERSLPELIDSFFVLLESSV